MLQQRVDNANVREKVTHQQQRHKLRHSHRCHEASAEQGLGNRPAVIEQHGQERSSDVAGEGGAHSPSQRPAEHTRERVRKGTAGGKAGQLPKIIKRIMMNQSVGLIRPILISGMISQKRHRPIMLITRIFCGKYGMSRTIISSQVLPRNIFHFLKKLRQY